MRYRLIALLAAAGLTLPGGAMAAETPEQTLQAIARCAVVSSGYSQMVAPETFPAATAADKALALRADQAVQAMQPSGEAAFVQVGEARFSAIVDAEATWFKANLDSIQIKGVPAIEAALDKLRPYAEACVKRAGLPAG